MNPRRKKRLTVVLASIAGVSAILGLLLFALEQNIDLFYTPTEIVQGKGDKFVKPDTGQRIRVGGLVVPGTVSRDEDTLEVTFDLVDTGPIVTVNYQGLLPDLFREGQGIVATGTLTSATTIKAHEVLAKHDENYMPRELEESLQKQNLTVKTAYNTN